MAHPPGRGDLGDIREQPDTRMAAYLRHGAIAAPAVSSRPCFLALQYFHQPGQGRQAKGGHMAGWEHEKVRALRHVRA